jgi:cytochrome P450
VNKLLQALRYTWHFPEFAAAQHARHGASWTLRLPGLEDAVVTSDRELIKMLLTGDPLTRRHANDILAPILGTGSVMQLEPAPHLVRRKQLLPPFHGDRVRGYGETMAALVAADLDGWPADGDVAVHPRARRLTLEIIQQVVLGSTDDAFAAELGELLDTFNSPLANLGLFAPALATRARWNVVAEPFWRQADRFDAMMGELAGDAREDPDSVLAMLRATGLSDEDLRDELKTLLTAGHETTATAIGWAADLLAHHPQVVRRLREGDRAYLAATAKEVLRIRTIAPVAVARTLVEPVGDLPAGTIVLVNAYALHMDPALFPQPRAFRPERFLEDEIQPYSYLPFGGGAHRCLGAALATLELEAAIAGICERFDLAPTGPPAKAMRRGPTLTPANGARVRAFARDRRSRATLQLKG